MANNSRIKELEIEIKKNQDAYYNNEALISDAEFDALMDELKELDPENALLTTEVGSDHTEGFKKAKHTILMGSQSKANTEAEMDKFVGGIDASLCLGQYKMDGASIELNYKNGKAVFRIFHRHLVISFCVRSWICTGKGRNSFREFDRHSNLPASGRSVPVPL